MKNKILAIIGGTVALFGLGYVMYVELGLHEANELPGEVDFIYIILMEVLYATFVTIIFSRWAQIKTFSTGAKAGLIIGAFIGGCSTLGMFATTELTTLTGVLLAAVTYAVRFGVAGGVIGWLLGRE